MATINWSDAKADYVTTQMSHRQIAEKYGVTESLVSKKAAKEKWSDARKEYCRKVERKKIEKSSEREANRYERLITMADRLADKIEKALDELEKRMVTHSIREKTIEYNNKERPDKPTKEIIKDEMQLVVAEDGLTDREGIKQIASALKDLKEIQSLRSDADTKEQDARIAKLEKEAARDEEAAQDITIRIEGLPEGWKE